MALLEFLTDHELYLKVKEYLVKEALSGVRNEVLDGAFDECACRNIDIYEKALKDSNFEIISMENYMPGLRVVEMHRIDFMNDVELSKLLHTIGASPNFPLTDDPVVDNVAILNLIGVARDNLLVCRVLGESMIGAGINDGDSLFVDKSDKGADGSIVVASADGNMLVKRLKRQGEALYLLSENSEFEPILVGEDMSFNIVGAVKQILKKVV